MHAQTTTRNGAFTMRWTVILLVCVAALLEILSWSKDTQSTLSIAIGGAVHLLALSCLFGAVLVVVLRVSTTRRLKLLICCAGVLVLSANFLNTTGKPAAWADFPLIGGHSAFQGWGERWFIVAGYVLFMGGLSLALGEVHTSNKALETKSAESAREAAERVRALKELDDKTKRLSAAEETARIGSWEWDERAQIMRCSEGLAALFSLRAGERELSYEELLSHVHHEERENVIAPSFKRGRRAGPLTTITDTLTVAARSECSTVGGPSWSMKTECRSEWSAPLRTSPS